MPTASSSTTRGRALPARLAQATMTNTAYPGGCATTARRGCGARGRGADNRDPRVRIGRPLWAAPRLRICLQPRADCAVSARSSGLKPGLGYVAGRPFRRARSSHSVVRRGASGRDPTGSDLGLLTQAGGSSRGAKARVSAHAGRGIDQEVDVAFHRPGVRAVGVSGLDRKALIGQIRHGGDDAVHITLIGSHLFLVTAAGSDQHDERRERASAVCEPRQLSPTDWSGWAVHHAAAHLIRPHRHARTN
jgi:hypothetical protein